MWKMLFPDTRDKVIAVLTVTAVGLLLILATLITSKLASSCSPEVDTTMEAKDLLDEQTDEAVDIEKARAKELETRLEAIEYELGVLREDIYKGVQDREELHEEIDSATTIDDIRAILRRGVR